MGFLGGIALVVYACAQIITFICVMRLMFGGFAAMRYRRRNIHYSKEYMHWMKCFLYRAPQATLFVFGNAGFCVVVSRYLDTVRNGAEWKMSSLGYIPFGIVSIAISMIMYHAMRQNCIKAVGEENAKELHRRISATGLSVFASIYLFPLTIVTEIFRLQAISEESEYETTLISDIGGSHVGQVRKARRLSDEESERERRKWDGF